MESHKALLLERAHISEQVFYRPTEE